MSTILVATLGTFLYHGAFFSGPNARNHCATTLAQVTARFEAERIVPLATSCAPLPILGSTEFGHQVQDLVLLQRLSREV